MEKTKVTSTVIFENIHNLEVGSKVYSVIHELKNFYSPCSVCNNTRKLTVRADNGFETEIECPKCSGKAVKGEFAREFKIFSVGEYYISSVSKVFSDKTQAVKEVVSLEYMSKETWGVKKVAKRIDDYINLKYIPEVSKWSSVEESEHIQLYLDKEVVAKLVKELNSAERVKINLHIGKTPAEKSEVK